MASSHAGPSGLRRRRGAKPAWPRDGRNARPDPEDAPKAASIIVLHEKAPGATFDLDYDLTTHMPLVSERFARFGLKGWRVTRSAGTLDGGDAPFSVAAILEFETPDQFKQAVAAEGSNVFGDVPNFSNRDPVLMISEVVGAA